MAKSRNAAATSSFCFRRVTSGESSARRRRGRPAVRAVKSLSGPAETDPDPEASETAEAEALVSFLPEGVVSSTGAIGEESRGGTGTRAEPGDGSADKNAPEPGTSVESFADAPSCEVVVVSVGESEGWFFFSSSEAETVSSALSSSAPSSDGSLSADSNARTSARAPSQAPSCDGRAEGFRVSGRVKSASAESEPSVAASVAFVSIAFVATEVSFRRSVVASEAAAAEPSPSISTLASSLFLSLSFSSAPSAFFSGKSFWPFRALA
mmetsp:Transcript_14520/g.62254  ORF Transcript_14520/g.62254 Transcript_14520/m.62254 type:complete len:267 (+) Transcript_14520:97-897(+)